MLFSFSSFVSRAFSPRFPGNDNRKFVWLKLWFLQYNEEISTYRVDQFVFKRQLEFIVIVIGGGKWKVIWVKILIWKRSTRLRKLCRNGGKCVELWRIRSEGFVSLPISQREPKPLLCDRPIRYRYQSTVCLMSSAGLED